MREGALRKMLAEVKLDAKRYFGGQRSVLRLMTYPPFFCVFWYRFGRWIYFEGCPRLLTLPAKVVYHVVSLILHNCLHVFLSPQTAIAPGFYLGHIGGIYINPEAAIGEGCSIGHHVTIGTSAMGRQGAPTIGDRVHIATGAVLIGRIRIGNDAHIAANTLVMTNVPEGATVMGVPGRVVMRARPLVKQESVS